MKKMLNVLLLFCLLLSAPFIFSAAAASDDHTDMPPEPPSGMQNPGMHAMSVLNFASDLNITGDQFEKLKALEKESSTADNALLKQLDSFMNDMRNELDKDEPDMKKLDAITDQIASLNKEMLKSRISNMLKIRSVLTRDQQKKLKESIKAKMKRFSKEHFPEMQDGEKPF
jgi:Spy/CpxP family protein refolding chaperone